MTRFDVLRKTELKIENVFLNNANLTTIAASAAHILGFEPDEVLVVDYRDGILVLDILNNCVDAYRIVGKKEPLLRELGALPGVSVSERTTVVADGMLGWIALDRGPAIEALQHGEKMISEIAGTIAKRVIVFSSGTEVKKREIEDTNMPAIQERFEQEGFKVTQGEVLEDTSAVIAAKVREAAEMGGYGVIITTGGVGAEDKDRTVEAIQALDPEAATPYICHFAIGTGRHVKDGVRIAVGDYNGTRIISLPGPHDEVQASLEPMISGLMSGAEKKELAELIAANLRVLLRTKTQHRDHD
ncbi:MAG: molybdopterin-binding protein [Desulfomonilia bacterium]|nr:molybdopterin-binding protein [Desulfomonilia bacterium]